MRASLVGTTLTDEGLGDITAAMNFLEAVAGIGVRTAHKGKQDADDFLMMSYISIFEQWRARRLPLNLFYVGCDIRGPNTATRGQ